MLMILVALLCLMSSFFNEFFLISGVFFSFVVMMMSVGGDFFSLGMFFFDDYTFLLVGLSVWLTFLISLVMIFSFKKKLFFFLSSCMMLFLILAFSSSSMLFFYIFFEVVLIPMFLMVVNWGAQMERLPASIYMLIYTLVGSLPLLVVLIFFKNYFCLSYLFMSFSKVDATTTIFFFFVLAFLIKLPIYGFHIWLPKAHVEAPISGSMMLAGILLKLGGYGLYRSSFFMYWGSLRGLDCLIISLSMVGAIIVGLLCICQIDLKMLIAYSSVCHMSMVVGGIFSGTEWGKSGAMLMMLSHGLVSSGLFCLANLLYERFFTRNMMLLKGMMMIFPSLSLLWFVFSVFNMSAPPSMNLVSELFLLGALMKFSSIFFFILVMISFLTGFYSLYLYSFTQHGKISFLMGGEMINIREYSLLFYHFFPLILFLMKVELFTCYF